MMKSFFRKLSSDSVSSESKKNKSKFKTKAETSYAKKEDESSSGSVMIIENSQKFHIGPTINLNTTNILTTETVSSAEKRNSDSSRAVPENVKDNLSNISEATILHFEVVSSKINDIKNLEKVLGLSEDQCQPLANKVEDEFYVCHLLFCWKKAKTREATVGLLLKILWEAKEYDAAIFLSDNL